MASRPLAKRRAPFTSSEHALFGPSVKMCLHHHRQPGARVVLCRYMNLRRPTLQQGGSVPKADDVDLRQWEARPPSSPKMAPVLSATKERIHARGTPRTPRSHKASALPHH